MWTLIAFAIGYIFARLHNLNINITLKNSERSKS